MQRFHIPYFEKQEFFIIEDKNIFHQLVKVLRIKEWKKVIFFDWKIQKDYIYEIIEINKKTIKTYFIEEIDKETELEFELNLFQALPNKLEKIEYILQKWVEVWIKNFVFYRSERSQKLIISNKKFDRLYKILLEAVEQCWRNIIPSFKLEAEDYKWKFLSNFEWDEYMKVWKNAIFLHTEDKESKNLQDYISSIVWNIEKQDIYIWPEWWFSEEEISYFERNNFSRIHLWNRILRTETAWIVVWFTLWQML